MNSLPSKILTIRMTPAFFEEVKAGAKRAGVSYNRYCLDALEIANGRRTKAEPEDQSKRPLGQDTGGSEGIGRGQDDGQGALEQAQRQD